MGLPILARHLNSRSCQCCIALFWGSAAVSYAKYHEVTVEICLKHVRCTVRFS